MAIQKHNTYYDITKPNSGIYCYDENGNHKEVLTKNDLNAISSISSINDKVTTLSSKTVREIKSTDTVTATPHTAPDGTIYYELEAAPEVSDTVIKGENGISATNQDTVWTIGLSANYLSANALDNLSGNWQNTFTAVTANSSVWDTVKDRVYSADFIPVKNDVDVLKTNSAHYPVESTNDFITVGSANHKFTLTFNSGDLVTSGWVEERLKDFGGFTTANPGTSGEPAVDEPSTKLIYLVPDISATGKDKYSEWIYGTNSAWICIGETSVDLEPLYELSGKFIDHSANENLHIQGDERTKWNEVSAKLNKDDFNSWSAKTESWDITEYSGGFGIDVSDHTISLTENYLSANALDNLSGKWEKASDTLSASSGKWNDTYETVSANSARWDKVDEKLDTSVFEAYTATADDIQYSGKNGIAIKDHEVWISAEYLSANALKDLSGKWENASDVVIADSAKWNSAYSAIASANLWNETYERVQASADEWDKVANKLDKSESAKYMLVEKIDKTTDDKISGYNGSELYYPPVKEYSGKDGIKVEDYFIGIDSGWLDERYQEKGDYYSASNPSGFINEDQAEAQILAKKYITSSVSELDNFYSKSQTSGANEIANAIKDFVPEDLLIATSGELKDWVSTNYYNKTETSSKTEIENAFDNIPKYILSGDSNITATSAQDGKNIRWDLAVNATPVVTDTKLTGNKGIYTHTTTNSGEWCVELVQSAYDAINYVQNKLDTSVAAQTYQPKGDYVSANEIEDMATQTWVGTQGYLTEVPSEYVTDTELQNTSAAITALIPSTAGLASEIDLQIVSAGVYAVSGELPNYLKVIAYEADSGKFALKSEIPIKVSDLTDSANYYKTTETSGATELSTEFAKYQTKGNYITSSDLVDSAKSATMTENLTDGTETSSFSEITASIDWCNTIANHYQTHSGEFVTSSISTITGTKQYALTSAGWIEVQGGGLSIPINIGSGNALNISTAESGTWGNNADGYLVIGNRSKAGNESFVFGNDSIAQNNSTVLNGGNSALHDSIAQGWKNIAIERSQAFGYNSSANNNSFAAGYSVVATDYSFAGGQAYNSTRGNILASDHSFALGVGSNNEPVIANKYSFAFGYAASAQNFAFAFGKAIDVEGSDGHAVIGVGGYNEKVQSAAIIVGNGTNIARHNAFVVYNDGNVSAKNYKAEGYTDSNNNYVEASVPKSIPNSGDNSMKVQKMFVCTSDNDIVAHAALANGEGCIFFRVG